MENWLDIKTGSVNTVIKIDKEKISSPVVQGQNLYVAKYYAKIKLNVLKLLEKLGEKVVLDRVHLTKV